MESSLYSIHDEEKLKKIIQKNKEKAFRYSQIEHDLYKDNQENFDDMNTLSKQTRKILNENFFYSSLTIHTALHSKNKQTTKFLLETTDKQKIEMVVMRHLSGRNTLCVSCQV